MDATVKSAKNVAAEAEPKKRIKHKTDPRIEQKITELRRKAKEHLSLKQFEEALRCLDIAVDLHSTSYKLYRMRSITLACLQEYSRSALDAERVIELAPHIMDGYYHKGFALFHLKDYAGSAHAFQEGLKLNPTDKSLRQGFWDAVALVSQSRTDQATANLDFSIAAAQAQQQQFGLARVAEGDER